MVNGPVCNSTKSLVVVPKTQSHAIGPYTIQNFVDFDTPPNTRLWSQVGTTVTITVLDQFGSALDAVYDGNGVVSEIISDIGLPNDYALLSSGVLVLPNDTFASGVKEDAVWCRMSDEVPSTLTASEVAQWVAGTLMFSGANNIFSAIGVQTRVG